MNGLLMMETGVMRQRMTDAHHTGTIRRRALPGRKVVTVRGTVRYSKQGEGPSIVSLFIWHADAWRCVARQAADASGNFAISAGEGFYYYLQATTTARGCDGDPVRHYAGRTGWFQLSEADTDRIYMHIVVSEQEAYVVA